MVTATPSRGPPAQHVEVATIGVHGAVAGRVDEVGGILPVRVCSVHVQLAAVCGGLSRTQPQPLLKLLLTNCGGGRMYAKYF